MGIIEIKLTDKCCNFLYINCSTFDIQFNIYHILSRITHVYNYTMFYIIVNFIIFVFNRNYIFHFRPFIFLPVKSINKQLAIVK